MYLLVGNPAAQSGKNRERIERASTLLDAQGLRHDLLPTSPGGRTVEDVARALVTGKYAAAIAMGGDGTFAEVAKGVIRSGTELPMGLLPTGTANDQGRSFGLSAAPSALADNVAVIAAGHTVPLDGGRVTLYDVLDTPTGEDWFFDSIGFGLSARVLKVRNEDRDIVSNLPIVRELYRDQLVYAGAVLQALLAGYLDEQRFEAEVRTPDAVLFYEDLTDLILKNTRYYAGEWVFDETSSPEDGEVELVPIRGRNEMLARLVVNNEQIPVKPPVSLTPIVRSSAFHVFVRERPGATQVDAQIDGEECPTAASYRVEVVRHALRLIVPAP